MTEEIRQPTEQPLESWKEIAAHLKRDVRTVMRWEKSEGLPVHRYLHQARSSVYAYPSELDAWKIDREPSLNAPPLITPWRRVTAAAGFALAVLLALGTVASGPILTPTRAAAQQFGGIVNRQVWAGPQTDTLGAPSPDGKYLSFVDWETGDLAVRDLQTGKNRRLTNKGTWAESPAYAFFSRWSPDGKQLIYDWYQESENTPGEILETELRIVGLDGSKPRVFYAPKGSGVDVADWSEDGKHILAVDWNGQIVSISISDGSVTVLKTPTTGSVYSYGLSFSPDGRYVLFDNRQSEGESQRDVFLLSTEGRPETRLVEHPADDYALGWTPDGKWALFASDRTGSVGIWAVRVADGKAQGAPEMLRAAAGDVLPMGFTRDGSFFYSLGWGEGDIYVAELDPQSGEVRAPAAKLIRQFEGRNSWPRYSPDGKNLAYVSARGPLMSVRQLGNVLCIRSLDTGKDRELPTEFGIIAAPRWMPDGRAVIIAAGGHRRERFCQVDLQTGSVRPVVEEAAGERLRDHDVSPDGKALYYVKRDNRSTACRIVRRALGTGEEKELYAGPPKQDLRIALSPDGHQLAFLNRPMKIDVHEKVLRVIPATGGEPTEIFRYKQWGRYVVPLAWSADGKYLLLPRQPTDARDNPDANWSLWRIPAKGGDAEKLALETRRFHDITMHPDGRRIAFHAPSSERLWNEIWVMENFLPLVAGSK